MRHQLFEHELAREAETFVEINGPDEGFEGVAVHGGARGTAAAPAIILDEGIQAQLAGDLTQRLAVDNPGADLGQEAFVFVRVLSEEKLGHDHAQHGIAEVFKALVGFTKTVNGRGARSGSVPKRQLIHAQIGGPCAQNVFDGLLKILLDLANSRLEKRQNG